MSCNMKTSTWPLLRRSALKTTAPLTQIISSESWLVDAEFSTIHPQIVRCLYCCKELPSCTRPGEPPVREVRNLMNDCIINDVQVSVRMKSKRGAWQDHEIDVYKNIGRPTWALTPTTRHCRTSILFLQVGVSLIRYHEQWSQNAILTTR